VNIRDLEIKIYVGFFKGPTTNISRKGCFKELVIPISNTFNYFDKFKNINIGGFNANMQLPFVFYYNFSYININVYTHTYIHIYIHFHEQKHLMIEKK